MPIRRLSIEPPVLNSSSPWASSFEDLLALYECPHTGAVTTRTSTRHGFEEDLRHKVVFSDTTLSSINSFGYSPHSLAKYIEWVKVILEKYPQASKPFIISITSAEPMELSQMIEDVQILRKMLHDSGDQLSRVGIEINTSCPNIEDRPPPSYEMESLAPILQVLQTHFHRDPTLVIGLKLPPYVYSMQNDRVLSAISLLSVADHNPIAFLTCINTLGNCVMLTSQAETTKSPESLFALPTTFGGLGGEYIHNLALGNVHSFDRLLRTHLDVALHEIGIIGVGGVTSRAAAIRMRQAGACCVAAATAFGKEGLAFFEKIND